MREFLKIFEFNVNRLFDSMNEKRGMYLSVDEILGSNTNEHINTYLCYIIYRQKGDVENFNNIIKLREKLKSFTVYVDIENEHINIKFGDLIFNHTKNFENEKRIKLYEQTKFKLFNTDISFDLELNEIKEYMLQIIDEKLATNNTNISKVNVDSFAMKYLRFLTIILTTHL